IPAGRDGDPGGIREFALLPLRRRDAHDPERRDCRLPALRAVENHRGRESRRADAPHGSGLDSSAGRRTDGGRRLAAHGGRVMAGATIARPSLARWLATAAALVCILAATAVGVWLSAKPAEAQQFLDAPARRGGYNSPSAVQLQRSRNDPNAQMLVTADEIQYDYSNERVSAVSHVQIHYAGSILEADKVIYDQKAKRLRAEGNVRLTDADGKIFYANMLDLRDDSRAGFVDSLRLDSPDKTRIAAVSAERTANNITVFQNGVYTACEPCAEDLTKPPLWQVKAARIIHDQTEKMVYYEDARMEFFGIPMAYIPFFSAPDPTVKRKTGFLMPSATFNSVYGFGVTTPFYWALAPNYDLTITPTLTSKQGPLLQAEWRHRLINGSYT